MLIMVIMVGALAGAAPLRVRDLVRYSARGKLAAIRTYALLAS